MHSRWKLKIKRWHDRESRKPQKCHVTLNRYFNIPSSIKVETIGNHKQVTFTPPNVFSLVKNPHDTIDFINNFIDELHHKQNNKHFHIDSKDVNYVTVDALIYLLALINNSYLNKAMHYSFSGSFPSDDSARKVYEESGFTKYVRAPFSIQPGETDRICIEIGHGNKAAIAKRICDFVCAKLGLTKRKSTQPLYKALIELLSNVYYHAYSLEEPLQKRWYIYAEHIDNYVRFVFVDTGNGIVKTVRKKLREKFKLLLGVSLNDGKVLSSVFDGEFRTQTKLLYRGNGLSTVYDQVYNGPFKNFQVISGKGICKINNLNGITSENIGVDLIGTLYTFDYCGGFGNDKD